MDDNTPLRCRACTGSYLLGKDIIGKDIMCRWCTEGWMNVDQFHAWMRFKSGPRPAAARVSTQRFDPHRVVILERLERAWSKVDKMRLGELVREAIILHLLLPDSAFDAKTLDEFLLKIDDKRLAEIIEYYVMFGGS